MGTIKVAILEIDGVELDISTEYDLADALTHIGYSGFDIDLVLTDYDFDVLVDYDGNVIVGV